MYCSEKQQCAVLLTSAYSAQMSMLLTKSKTSSTVQDRESSLDSNGHFLRHPVEEEVDIPLSNREVGRKAFRGVVGASSSSTLISNSDVLAHLLGTEDERSKGE